MPAVSPRKGYKQIFKAISRMTLVGMRRFQSWSIGKNYRVRVNSTIVCNLWPRPRASNDGSTWCLECPLLLFICGMLQEASWSFIAVSRSSHSHTRQPGSLFSNTHTSWAPASTFRKFQSKGGEKTDAALRPTALQLSSSAHVWWRNRSRMHFKDLIHIVQDDAFTVQFMGFPVQQMVQ